jgi:hypothetical protein
MLDLTDIASGSTAMRDRATQSGCGRAVSLIAGISLHAAIWYPLIEARDVSAAELRDVDVHENVAVIEQPVAVDVERSLANAPCVLAGEIMAASDDGKDKDFVWASDNLCRFGIWMFGNNRCGLDFVWPAVKHLENHRSLGDVARCASEVNDGNFETRIGGADVPNRSWPKVCYQIRSGSTNFIDVDVRPFEMSQCALGDVCRTATSEPRFVAGLSQSPGKPRNEDGRDSRYERGIAEEFASLPERDQNYIIRGAIVLCLCGGLLANLCFKWAEHQDSDDQQHKSKKKRNDGPI